jgi:hypothetical protein
MDQEKRKEKATLVVTHLWIYLWLAETSPQPISQTTWLKVTPCKEKKRLRW